MIDRLYDCRDSLADLSSEFMVEDDDPVLIHLKQPLRRLEDAVPSDSNILAIQRILAGSGKALFWGPPGSGKALAAEAIASEMGRPLGIVMMDSILSSDGTRLKLRRILDYVSSRPVVVLLDRFDALTGKITKKLRTALQMLDDYTGDSVLIATASRRRIIRPDVLRRFEEVLVFELPDAEQIWELLEIKLRGVRRNFEMVEELGTGQLCSIRIVLHSWNDLL